MNVTMADVCVSNGKLWTIDLRGQIYFRDGITEEKPMGESWQVVGGCSQKKLKQIAVKEGHFFGVDEDNNLWCSQISNQYQEQIFSEETQRPNQQLQDQINILVQQSTHQQTITNLNNQITNLQTQLAAAQQETQALQNQLNQLLGISSETTETQMEAKVQQPNLPPK